MPTGTPVKTLKPGMGLYQVMYMPSRAPDKSKPWCVINLQTGDAPPGRWFTTKEDALAQARALYAQLGSKAKVQSEGQDVLNAYFMFADADTLVADDGVKWVEAMAPKAYHTPAYGEVQVTPTKIDNFVRAVNTNVRGQDIAINFEHGIDPAKGLKAAGWIKQARKNDRGNLELAVDFTSPAKEEIKNGEWKYFSLEWEDQWMHPDGIFFDDVIVGGALTNRPVAKGLMPINFSEIFAEVDPPDYQFAQWDTAYVNNLPDSAFLYIEPGGTKDSSGKTEPRSLRHLPYKDANGNIDLPHVRNAASRLGQAATGSSWKGFTDSTRTSLQARCAQMLNAKNASELAEIDKAFSEQKELEHSQPGTGNPPTPRFTDSGIDDLAIVTGSRRDTPPYAIPPQTGVVTGEVNGEIVIGFSEAEAVGYLTSAVAGLRRIHTNDADKLIEDIERLLAIDSRTRSFNEMQRLTNEVRTYFRGNKGLDNSTSTGGYTVGELTDRDLRELRSVLNVDDDARIVEAVKVKFGELSALRDAVSASEQERIFAEQYPQYYAEHQALVHRDRTNTAKSFSESVSKIRKAEGFGLKTTKQGLSTAALEKIEEVHVKFSEQKATVDDFEDVIKIIVNGGIVQFGEIGSSNDDDVPEIDTSGPTGIAAARKVFAEQVAKVQREHPDMSYAEAVAEAGKKHPDLAESYKVTLPA